MGHAYAVLLSGGPSQLKMWSLQIQGGPTTTLDMASCALAQSVCGMRLTSQIYPHLLERCITWIFNSISMPPALQRRQRLI
jgi:hypothetical protein